MEKENKKQEEIKIEKKDTSKSKDFDSSQKSGISDIEKTAEKKPEESKEKAEEKEKKEKKPEIVKKEKAVVRGKDLSMSTKDSVSICNFIRKRKIEDAIKILEEVVEKKRAVPMKGEYPHRKGKGMERGSYPIKACKEFIMLLRSLNANASVNNMGESYISLCKASIASRPYRRFGQQRFKRANVDLEASELKNSEGAQKSEQTGKISDTREIKQKEKKIGNKKEVKEK